MAFCVRYGLLRGEALHFPQVFDLFERLFVLQLAAHLPSLLVDRAVMLLNLHVQLCDHAPKLFDTRALEARSVYGLDVNAVKTFVCHLKTCG